MQQKSNQYFQIFVKFMPFIKIFCMKWRKYQAKGSPDTDWAREFDHEPNNGM